MGFARATTVLHFDGTTAAELNKLIADAPDHAVIKLKPIDYAFDQSIIIARNDITLSGSGRTKTRLRFRLHNLDDGDFIKVMGGWKERIGRVTHTAQRSARSFMLAPGHRLKPGDVVYLSRPNTAELLEEHAWQHLPKQAAKRRPLREAIATVAQADWLSVQLASGLPANFPKRQSTVHRLHAARNVVLSDLTLLFDNNRPEPYDFTNPFPNWISAAAIRLDRTVDARIERVNILNPPSKGIALDSSIQATLDDIQIDGSHNKGTGGAGYGIELRETFDSKLRNLTILNTRHAVLFSSWHLEAGNEIHIRHTNRDVNFHGGLDRANVVAIDSMVLDYDQSQRKGRPKQAWSAISKGGRTHPNTNFFASNIIAMKEVRGAWRNDILIAGQSGSKLNGQKGYDVIIGGPGKDIATGGPQSDVFLLGHGNDIITDFQPGGGGSGESEGGDRLWLPLSFADVAGLAVQKDQGLLIRWDADASIFLEGVQFGQLRAENIIKCMSKCDDRLLARRYQLEPGAPQW